MRVVRELFFDQHGTIDVYCECDGINEPAKGNDSLMQFAGLLDRHGKEIYEGDIVKTPRNRKAKVSFGNGAFWFVGFPFYEKSFFDKQSKTWKTQNAEKWEVIGNIYENPEIIKS